MTNDEMLIATHNHKTRVRQDKISLKWFVHRKEMTRAGRFDWVVDSGPYDTKQEALEPTTKKDDE